MALSGCAARRVQPQRIISTSWSTVRALPPDTRVGVALEDDEIRYGRVTDVTDDTLTIWERHGAEAIARSRVVRLAIVTSTGSSRAPNVVKWSITGAVIAGALAWLASAMEENARQSGSKGLLLLGGIGLGAGLGSQFPPAERLHEQVVYIRP